MVTILVDQSWILQNVEQDSVSNLAIYQCDLIDEWIKLNQVGFFVAKKGNFEKESECQLENSRENFTLLFDVNERLFSNFIAQQVQIKTEITLNSWCARFFHIISCIVFV